MFGHPSAFLLGKKYADSCLCKIFAPQLIKISGILLIDNGNCHVQLPQKVCSFFCDAKVKGLLANFLYRGDAGIGGYHIVSTYEGVNLFLIEGLHTLGRFGKRHDLNVSLVVFLPALQAGKHAGIAFHGSDPFPLVGADVLTLHGIVVFTFVNIEGLIEHFAVRVADLAGPIL